MATMPVTPAVHRLVLLLALLAAAPASTRARSSSRAGSLHPSLTSTPYHPSHPTSGLQPPLQWQWWNDDVPSPRLPSSPQPSSPSSHLWRSLTSAKSSFPADLQPMGAAHGGSLSQSQVRQDKAALGLYYYEHNPVNRIAAFSPRYREETSLGQLVSSTSRRRSFEKKKNLLRKLRRRYRSLNSETPGSARRFDSPKHHTVHAGGKKNSPSPGHHPRRKADQGNNNDDSYHDPRRRHKQGLEPQDVHITLTVPSTTLQPLLLSLPLISKRDTYTSSGSSSSFSSSSFSSSPHGEVEIVGLRVQDWDATNTTVVLSLRDHRRKKEEELEDTQGEKLHEEEEGEEGGQEEEEEEGRDFQRTPFLSRPKRTPRRRTSIGMNARIRARMLAHRLSISYRHVQPCSYKDRYYCMNGGTCVFVGALDIKTCRCPIGYTGVRCELIDQEYILSLLTDSIIFS